MTLDELRQKERDAYHRYMYYEAAERGYDRVAAAEAHRDWIAARRELAEAEAWEIEEEKHRELLGRLDEPKPSASQVLSEMLTTMVVAEKSEP